MIQKEECCITLKSLGYFNIKPMTYSMNDRNADSHLKQAEKHKFISQVLVRVIMYYSLLSDYFVLLFYFIFKP